MRLKKSSSGMVGPRGGTSGGGQRWSSILEDWADIDTQVGASCPQPSGPRPRAQAPQGPLQAGAAIWWQCPLKPESRSGHLGPPWASAPEADLGARTQNGPCREPRHVAGLDMGLCRQPPRFAPEAPRPGVFLSRRDRVGQHGAPQGPVESGGPGGSRASLQGLAQKGWEPVQSLECACMWAGGSGVLGRGRFGGSSDSPRAALSSPLWD